MPTAGTFCRGIPATVRQIATGSHWPRAGEARYHPGQETLISPATLPLQETLPVPHALLVRTVHFSADLLDRRPVWSDEGNQSLLRGPVPARLEWIRVFEADVLAAEVEGR